MSRLQDALVYLVAAPVAVPLSKKPGSGSVPGYLTAGTVIGPAALKLVGDPDHTPHFAWLGIVFLLFIIGLETKRPRLWVLRRMVFGLGTAQGLLTAVAIATVTLAFGVELCSSIVVGLILTLSSTAFVLQMLTEKNN